MWMVWFNFKTSHVIVYHLLLLFAYPVSTFQNISCYCLSVEYPADVRAGVLFQNISCYCLSLNATACEVWTDFKTSHVVVYQKRRECDIDSVRISKHLMLLFITKPFIKIELCWYFKTSHVIVYRGNVM